MKHLIYILLALWCGLSYAQVQTAGTFDAKTGVLLVDTTKPAGVTIAEKYEQKPITVTGTLNTKVPQVVKADSKQALRFICQTSKRVTNPDSTVSTYWVERAIDGAYAEIYSDKVIITDYEGKRYSYPNGKYRFYAINTADAKHSPRGFYLATTGSDAAAGTHAAPWKTCSIINRNDSSLVGADSVYFEGGETFGAAQNDTTLTVPSSGSAGSPITFTSHGTGRATITGAAPSTVWGAGTGWVDGTTGYGAGRWYHVVAKAESAYACWKQDSLMTKVSTLASLDAHKEWTFRTGTPDTLVAFFNAAGDTADVKRSKNNVVTTSNKSYLTIENLHITKGTGDFVASSISGNLYLINGSNIIVSKCLIDSMGYSGINTTASSLTVQYCVIKNNGSVSIWGESNNGNLYNNILYKQIALTSGRTGWNIKNNIFITQVGEGFFSIYVNNTFTATNNRYYDVSGSYRWWRGDDWVVGLAAWQAATGQDANSSTDNPLFVSPTDYRLLATSSCIDAGVAIAGLTTDYNGHKIVGNPDIGAFESNYGTFYVDGTNGSDSGNGSIGQMWKTIAKFDSSDVVARGGAATLNIRGMLREMLTVPKDTVTVAGNDSTVINGADVVTGFANVATVAINDTIYQPSTASVENSPNTARELRQIIHKEGGGGTALADTAYKVRLRIHASVAAGGTISNAAIQLRTGLINFTTTPIAITWNGGSSTITYSDSDHPVSDPITLSLDKTKDYIISFHTTTGNRSFEYRIVSGDSVYYKDSSGADESQTASVTGYTVMDQYNLVMSLERVTTTPSSIWSKVIATQPKILFRDGVLCTNFSSVDSLLSNYRWNWTSSVLKVYSSTDPSGAVWFAGQRNACITMTNKKNITVQNMRLSMSNADSAAGGNFRCYVNSGVIPNITLTDVESDSCYWAGFVFKVNGGATLKSINNTRISTKYTHGVGTTAGSIFFFGAGGELRDITQTDTHVTGSLDNQGRHGICYNHVDNVLDLRSHIKNSGSSAINIEGGSDSVQVSYALFDTVGTGAGDRNCIGIGGIGGGGNNTNITIDHSDFRYGNTVNPAIEIANTTVAGEKDSIVVIEKNIFGNGSGTTPGGIKLDGARGHVVYIRNNIFDGVHGHAIEVSDTTSVATVYNNTIINSSNGDGIYFTKGSLTMKGNILSENFMETVVTAGYGGTAVIDSNVVYHSAGGTFMTWNGTDYNWANWKKNSSQDANSVNANPDLTANYVPKVDFIGLGLGFDYGQITDYDSRPKIGDAWDAGAKEYYASGESSGSRRRTRILILFEF